jgi:hypothetical protein
VSRVGCVASRAPRWAGKSVLRRDSLAGTALACAEPVSAATFTVSDQTSLFNAMRNMALDRSSDHTINVTASFTMSTPVTPIVLDAGRSVTINGDGQTIDAATPSGLSSHSGTTTINNVRILNA